ncbi:MAG TPA: glucose-6-phosphate dehydrogenase [Xanthobacteraceae bacterium]|jgi:glucose-6-phosphate 1-dehydrogenase|nr:glucose-6-phosphate dehydrogenase [Xanthobacteraceae bacterium]
MMARTVGNGRKASATNAKVADPCSFVIFGASGDLTHRLLVPALYNLEASGLLPEAFALIGVARSEMSDDAFRDDLAKSLPKFATRKIDDAVVKRLLDSVSYVQGSPEDDSTYDKLGKVLDGIEKKRETKGNRLFYLATPPTAFAPIGCHLGRSGLAKEANGTAAKGPWRRVVIEKPFGTDLASARALNKELLSILDEDQIFRIDHYLGKETVQNILVLRFANGLFEPIWNRHHIEHVQITVAESLDVGRRGNYYDATGALRDMVPNHLLQLLSLIAMEPPSRFAADSVRAEKAQLLDAVQIQTHEEALRNVVRAQYDSGRAGDEKIEAYRSAKDVKPDSTTETYVALKLMIDNWRWAGIPFYLRTGKALSGKKTEVAIKFRQAPVAMFRDTPVDRLADNFLVIGIQPDEFIGLEFNAKIPGPTISIGGVGMTFNYGDYFDTTPSTGYETLIYDCMIGDAILYPRADGIEAGWRIVQPFLDAWREALRQGLATYQGGSEGPKEADDLLRRDGRRWRPIA